MSGPDAHQRITALALQIAATPPERRDRRAYLAQVPWRLVDELRDELAAAGVDWRSFKRQLAAETALTRATNSASDRRPRHEPYR